LRLLAVTVLTNLTADDVKQQGSSLTPPDLVLRRAQLAREAGVDGVIASGQEAARIREGIGPGFLIVTPGIRLTGSATDDQERITTPDHAVAAGADYIVVGRPITQADDPVAVAQTFIHHIREACGKKR
jgi:orotidine-5'-phosphate decarboxylase